MHRSILEVASLWGERTDVGKWNIEEDYVLYCLGFVGSKVWRGDKDAGEWDGKDVVVVVVVFAFDSVLRFRDESFASMAAIRASVLK